MVIIKINNKISETIKKHKIESGVQIQFIAKKAGMSQQTLANYYKSEDLCLSTLCKIAYGVGCRLEDLYSVDVFDDNGKKLDVDIHMSTKERYERERNNLIGHNEEKKSVQQFKLNRYVKK